MARRNAGRCRKYESSRLRSMIPMLVTPPRIAARVSLCASCSNESSLPMWTCGSKIPGSTTLPPAASTSCAGPESFSPMPERRLPQMPTSAATVPTPGMMSVPLRTTRSKRGLTAGSCCHGGERSCRAFEAEQAASRSVERRGMLRLSDRQKAFALMSAPALRTIVSAQPSTLKGVRRAGRVPLRWFCGTHHFRLDRVVEHDPCLLHLWSKRGTKLPLQAPYQRVTKRNEMRSLYSKLRVLAACVADNGLAYFTLIERTDNRGEGIHQLELLPFHIVREQPSRIGREFEQSAVELLGEFSTERPQRVE